ncbi:MAG TPA: hypothetical protein H9829_06990 [Candidatus Tetragenococcus pullicola]|nr:hypothetical protein [Candidatus Tetragenococcus pullicola]
MGTFLAVIGSFAFLGGIGYGLFSLIRKNHRARNSFIVSIIGVVVFLIGGSLIPETENSSESKNVPVKKSKSLSKKTSSKSKPHKVAKAKESSSTSSSKPKRQSKTKEIILAEKLPKNVLHGYRDKKDSKSNNTGWIVKGRDYVHFWTNDKGIIQSMKLDFRDLPLMADDSGNEEYITDNTAKDATKVSDLGDNKYLYHSKKYNLNYQIDFQKNSAGDITQISIFPEQ